MSIYQYRSLRLPLNPFLKKFQKFHKETISKLTCKNYLTKASGSTFLRYATRKMEFTLNLFIVLILQPTWPSLEKNVFGNAPSVNNE